MKRLLTNVLVMILLGISSAAWAAGPLETIRTNVNEVLSVLTDPALEGESHKDAKRIRLEKIADRMFDFETLARFTLGIHWRELSSSQQKEFTSLYRKLLERTYMDKILAYTNEKIVFDKEAKLSSNKAEVQSTVISSTAKTPMIYRLLQSDGSWRVYDVVIEGVSLVKNYRSQFNSILAKEPPADMLKELRQKVS